MKTVISLGIVVTIILSAAFLNTFGVAVTAIFFSLAVLTLVWIGWGENIKKSFREFWQELNRPLTADEEKEITEALKNQPHNPLQNPYDLYNSNNFL